MVRSGRWAIALIVVVGAIAIASPDEGRRVAAEDIVRFEDGHSGEIVEVPTELARSWAEASDTSRPSAEAAEETASLPSLAAVDLADPALRTARPSQWVQPAPKRCRRYKRQRFCDGPLRVPVPDAEAAARIQALSIGSARTANFLLGSGPEPRWVDAAAARPSRSLQWPVEGGRLWRGLKPERGKGRRRRPAHKGVDIGAATGTPVRSVNDGLVVYANNELRGYGNLIAIVHADTTVTFYAHLDEAWVSAGTRVRRGQVIGAVGTTGMTHGAHLHFEWRKNGAPLDPLPHFVGRPSSKEAPSDEAPSDAPADDEEHEHLAGDN